MRIREQMISAVLVAMGSFMFGSLAIAKEPVFVYGPGGPLPAMKAAAGYFNAHYHANVQVTAGPLGKWKNQAMKNSDIIYSGSENMMTNYLGRLPGIIDQKSIYPTYLRPAAIIVHPGNPLHINRFSDLLKPGVSVMVVQGAGQTGLWEDIAGKNGNIKTIRRLRKNIVYFAPNSAKALSRWIGKDSPDAWIIYNIWQIAHPKIGQIVNIGQRHIIYRDMDISLTYRGDKNKTARKFYEFLLSPAGEKIFYKYGWSN